MKILKTLSLVALFALLGAPLAFAKADVVNLYAEALMTADTAELEKILAPNFWYVGPHGHIMDKDHFIAELRDKKLVVDRLSLRNQRETQVGQTRIVTSNGVFYGKSVLPRPQGLMRYCMVIGDNNGAEQIVLVQVTPVIGTDNCVDGNCQIK
ncbi:MAG: nuclear transport factor 2 family protein [Desulfovibrio sp.]|nr:nuclear transport factor 2 family protein [Desulfovibrio sp.]